MMENVESENVWQQEDLEFVAHSKTIPWNLLKGKSIFITGATGLIGSFLTKLLVCRNRLFHDDIQIYALVRNLEKAKALIPQSGNVHLVHGDICGDYPLPSDLNFIVHAASVTSSKMFVSKPVETIRTALFGTERLLQKAKSLTLDGFLYLSSLEVYGVPFDGTIQIPETYFGRIDPMQVRSSYSEGKRMAECLCASFAAEYSVPVKVARLTQTFGAGVAYDDGRVFAQFARSAIEGKDIVLRTKGETLRNYCYVADAVSAMLFILLKGKVGEAYNVANEDTGISVVDMAEFVVKNFSQGKSRVVFDLAEDAAQLGYNPVVKACLNVDKLKSLGWSAKFNLYQMYERMIGSMRK